MMGTQDQAKLIQLRNEQRVAIETEDYEAAARLRDEIAAMEQSLRSAPTPPVPKTRGRKKAKPEPEA
jgi:protein-arginine kinase activator protein McsA